jgi:DeoR/GlpR family transcriptional regulator of sugar metabolism
MAKSNKDDAVAMLAPHRRLKIIELLKEEGSARVSHLSKIFNVSEPTIRQDLEKLEIEILMTGGEFKAPTLSLTGEKAAKFFENIHVNKLFLATGGISHEAGLTYPGFNDLSVKKSMIDSASEIYLVADSTKIGKISFASLGSLEPIDYFITDNGIKKEDIENFKKKGIEVIIASEK